MICFTSIESFLYFHACADFDRYVAEAVAQFGHQRTAIGLSLSGWWGGTNLPSIYDVTARIANLQTHGVRQVALDIDWANPSYQDNQASIDLIQLGLMAGWRGNVGMNWETMCV